MAAPETRTQASLRIERTFAAPPEKVFAAWTTAEGLTRWLAPTDEYTVHVTTLDLRVGGRYRVEMRHSGGNVHRVGGVYQEITPPRKLVFTWMWENGPADADTLVTVELSAEPGGKTKLVLTHERFTDLPARDEHAKGWAGCFDRLAKAV
jgi:uncharacterized protein YndB with AHSA1/START domain